MSQRDEGIVFSYDVNYNIYILLCKYCKLIED
jgi:hypothetical protein